MSALTNTIDTIDTQIGAWAPAFTNRQETYLSSHGVYWQGLIFSSVIPADGADAVMDLWTSHPGYQPATWQNLNGAAPSLKCALVVDQYVSPTGPGWVLTGYVYQAGVLWARSIQHGPETWRAQGWHTVSQAG